MGEGRVIVIDIGKTVAKLSLWTRDGLCLERLTRANAALPGDAYPALDTAATADWLMQVLRQFAAHPVEAIVPVAHGAAVAGIRSGVLAFSVPDYEWALPAADLATYREQRDPFAVTGSPALPMGLNLGAQLHALEALGSFEGVTLMPYAQYWAWLLSGVAVSEVTSLGGHTDLWSPAAADFSPMARRRGWAARFAPLVHAGDAIGTLLPGLAAFTGLSPHVRIHAGLHDSNAALFAARGFPEIAGEEATVLSTGTWFVAMRSGGSCTDPAVMSEARDCLVNVDVEGQPVPSARFIGGRELELLGARIDQPGTDGLDGVLAESVMVLPSQVRGSGPFPQACGRWINEPSDPAQRRAAAALYAALMVDESLALIGTRGTLLIEGRFAGSELFTRALASMHPEWRVLAITGEADVSFGALRLLQPGLAPHATLAQVAPLQADISSYRARWRSKIEQGESRNGRD